MPRNKEQKTNNKEQTTKNKKHRRRELMLNSKKALKSSLHIAVPACIAVCFYFPVKIAMILSGDSYFKALSNDRELWKICLLMSVAAIVFMSFTIVKGWKQKLYEDKLGKKREFSLDYQPYGDAHWAEPCEYSQMAKVRPLKDCKGTILGQLTMDGSQCVDMFRPPRINKHILAIGSSGSGKSFALVEPMIMQAVKQRHSIIVTDPKGELYCDTAAYLERNGYRIRRFDLITLPKSDGWDCLKFLRGLKGDELETNAQIFATIVVTNIEANDSIYARGSIALLKALVLYVVLEESIPENEKTMKKINEMLQQNGVEYLETVFGSASAAITPAVNAYKTFKQASPNLYGNILSHLATGMQILQTGMVEKILSTDDIDLNMPGDEPCAYFCRFSATNNTFRFVSAMFFSMLFISLIDHADRQPSKKLSVPVDFIMDEFPSVGRIPDWLEKISNIRSYGITATMIVQGMSQLRGVYGDDAVMIIGNCGTIINIGMNDIETAQWFQDRIGSTSIKVSTESVEPGSVFSSDASRLLGRVSKGVGRDYLISVSDIFNMSVDDSIIVFQHCNPIYAHKVPITLFEDFKREERINEANIPDFDDRAGRLRLRREEEFRIARYNREHPFIEQPEDEEYEEPVDFASMSIPAILMLVIREDIQALKKVLKAVCSSEKKLPPPTRKQHETAVPLRENLVAKDDIYTTDMNFLLDDSAELSGLGETSDSDYRPRIVQPVEETDTGTEPEPELEISKPDIAEPKSKQNVRPSEQAARSDVFANMKSDKAPLKNVKGKKVEAAVMPFK